MHPFTLIFLAALVTGLLLRLWLAQRQIACVTAHRDRVPDAFADVISPDVHRRAADYAIERTRLGRLEMPVEAGILLAWTLGGGLAAVDTTWRALELGPLVAGVGVLLTVVAVGALIDLPFRIWRTFVIESRFGFNRTTPALFATDQMRAVILLLALGVPLAAVVLWLMQTAGGWWWFWVWTVWLAFNLFIVWAWPAFIAPWFNRFTPLNDPDMRGRIDQLLARCGFASKGVFIMDGSRRSGHGNAYFTGVGRSKRIVLFDTLLEQLDPAEVEAVLAHELGHFRHRHIAKGIALIAAASLAALAMFGWLAEQPWFYHALGVTSPSAHVALALLLLVLPVFSFFVQPLFAHVSRRHEFEADAFAATQASARDLASALIGLYRENASTLIPDPLHSAFYDSHPPAVQRIEALRRAATSPTVDAPHPSL